MKKKFFLLTNKMCMLLFTLVHFFCFEKQLEAKNIALFMDFLTNEDENNKYNSNILVPFYQSILGDSFRVMYVKIEDKDEMIHKINDLRIQNNSITHVFIKAHSSMNSKKIRLTGLNSENRNTIEIFYGKKSNEYNRSLEQLIMPIKQLFAERLFIGFLGCYSFAKVTKDNHQSLLESLERLFGSKEITAFGQIDKLYDFSTPPRKVASFDLSSKNNWGMVISSGMLSTFLLGVSVLDHSFPAEHKAVFMLASAFAALGMKSFQSFLTSNRALLIGAHLDKDIFKPISYGDLYDILPKLTHLNLEEAKNAMNCTGEAKMAKFCDNMKGSMRILVHFYKSLFL